MSKLPAFFALLLVHGVIACGNGDPGQGSSAPPPPSSSSSNPDDGGSGAADTGPVQGATSQLGSASDDASLATDTAPPFENPAPEDGGCTAPNLICGGGAEDDAGPACVAVTSDTNNCGACGHQCAGPSAICIGGQCACSQLGFLYCASAAACIDTTGDSNNCGTCGNVCSQGQSCTGSLCQ